MTQEKYESAKEQAYLDILTTCLSRLNIDTAEKNLLIELYKYKTERNEAIRGLRSICEDYGDNDWSDYQNIADIIEKHLLTYLC